LHQSGHASAAEQRLVAKLLHPKFLMPIGGEDRHRAKFREYVAQSLGYTKDKVLTPKVGEILGISNGEIKVIDQIEIRPRTVDGLGIGDVGPIVLSDRRSLSQSGMIVLIIPRRAGQLNLKQMQVVSKGFVFMKEAEEVIDFIEKETASIIHKLGKKGDSAIREALERQLGRKLYKIIRREPMIIPVIMDV
jgi:ribonuclease J